MVQSFEGWCLQDASIEASKVEVKELGGDGQRGLFAKAEIFPGERFLYIPCASQIGEDTIRRQGSALLDETSIKQHVGKDGNDDANKLALAMIEEIRRLLVDPSSMVHMTAKAVQYEWRGDDGVALYLMACRKILLSSSSNEEASSSSRAAQANIGVPSAQEEVALTEMMVKAINLEDDGHEEEQEEDTENAILSESPYLSFLPHIACLPDSFPTNPLYYSEEELSRIEGTNCHGFTIRMLSQIRSDWIQVSAVLRAYQATDDRRLQEGEAADSSSLPFWDPDSDADLDLYRWAICNIYSRSTDFVLQASNEQQVCGRRVIAPLFDMMNHEFQSDVTHAMDERGNISVFNGSAQSIAAGSEIFLNYGNFPNEKLLLVYGFVVPGNPHDAVQIYAPIRPSDPLYDLKARLLHEKCGIISVNNPHLLRRPIVATTSVIPDTLLSVLRVVGCRTEEELGILRNRQEEEGTNEATTSIKRLGLVSCENELSALEALGTALHTMARRIALNLISDESLQGASNLNPTRPGSLPPALKEEGTGTRKQKEAVVSAKERLQAGGTNLWNAKILCQSEYAILQRALEEIAERASSITISRLGQ